jgi:hypothetical protein
MTGHTLGRMTSKHLHTTFTPTVQVPPSTGTVQQPAHPVPHHTFKQREAVYTRRGAAGKQCKQGHAFHDAC